MKAIVFVTAALVVLATATIDGKSDETGGIQRKLSMEHGADYIKVGSSMKDSATKSESKLQMTLHAEGKSPMRIRVKMYAKDADAKAKLQLRVTFASIVEFNETSSTFDGYNSSIDPLVKQFIFDNTAWRNIGDATKTTDATTGVTTYRYFLAYPHPNNAAKNLVEMNISFGDGLYKVDDVAYTPEQFKVDVGILDWPWVSTKNYLALEAKVQSRVQRQVRAGNTEGECNCDEGEYNARFSWVGTATAEGQSGNIVVTSKRENVTADADAEADGDIETGNRWYFSFNHAGASKIIWDPTIEGSPAARAGAALLALFVAIAGILF